jgi:hypothetical protein
VLSGLANIAGDINAYRKRLKWSERERNGVTHHIVAGFETPIAVSALVWSALVIFFVIAPAPSLAPVWVIGGMVLVGGIYLAYLWVAKPEVLNNEPGIDLFEIESGGRRACGDPAALRHRLPHR